MNFDPKELILGLQDPSERFVFQGGSLYAKAIAECLEGKEAKVKEQEKRIEELELFRRADRIKFNTACGQRDVLRHEVEGLRDTLDEHEGLWREQDTKQAKEIEILKQLQPTWALGSAYLATTALSRLWQLLGAAHQTEAVQKLQRRISDEQHLRHLLFLAHGSDEHYLYGDDGERQCNACGIDFNVDSPELIEQKITAYHLRKMAHAQKEGHE